MVCLLYASCEHLGDPADLFKLGVFILFSKVISCTITGQCLAWKTFLDSFGRSMPSLILDTWLWSLSSFAWRQLQPYVRLWMRYSLILTCYSLYGDQFAIWQRGWSSSNPHTATQHRCLSPWDSSMVTFCTMRQAWRRIIIMGDHILVQKHITTGDTSFSWTHFG